MMPPMPRIDVLPSLLSADFGHLADDLARCREAGAEVLHCDIMDGHFVPNISFGPMLLEHIRKHTDCRLDVHLMLTDPLRYAADFCAAGADAITVHVEAVGPRRIEESIEQLRQLGCAVGLAFNPDTDPALWFRCFDRVDLVMFMTVYPGFGGQSFIAETRPFIRRTRQTFPELDIQVDGGIGRDTIPTVVADGANRLVCGSAFFKDTDPADFIRSARALSAT
jgi:ribulose-phosphate 3-epimerase